MLYCDFLKPTRFDLANKVLFYLALGKGRISAASFSAIVAGNAGYNLEERLMQPAVGLSTKVMSGKEGAIFLFISWLLVSPVPLDSLALDVLFVKVYHNWKRPVSPKVGPARDENEVQPSDRTDQWDLSARSILESCGPLVVVDAGNGLLHFTSPIVQRHFVQSVSDQERSRLAASVITTCLDYLANTKDFPQGCYATEKELAQLLKQHPVLYHVAYLASYFALIQDGDCQESGSVYGKMFDALSSPKRLLMTQLLLYVREDDYEEYNGLRWDEFVLRIETMSKLHLAALWGQIRLVQAFLDEDSASAASTNSVYSTPLHEAAKFSSSVVVKTILRAKPDIVHSVDSEGNTPLHYACRAAKMDTIVLLFESRCTSETLKGLGNIKLTDIGRALPRYCFAKSGLKEAGDLAHCKGVAMLRAIEDGLDVIAELLIDEGANVNTMVENGASALYTAVQKGQDGLAAMLLARGADPTTGVPADQEPVLHSAMRKHMPSTIRELLDNPDHDINYKDSKGRTALFTALDLEDEEWAKVIMNDLLDHGLDVDIRDNDDLHIMHVAAEKGYMDLFSAISYQSRLAEEPKDKAGRTPFDIARDRGHWDIATFIRPTYEFSTQYGIPAVLLKRS
jgi:ankyrin repeat protein